MDIEVQSGADVGMAEEDADGLVVALALNAAGGEAMPQAVETHLGKTQLLLELVEIAAVCARLGG